MRLVCPRGSEGGSVRLLAILAAATLLVAGLLAGGLASRARAQSAGLDEYRFPAGTAVQAPGGAGAQGGAATSSAADQTIELPGGYPLTTPVVTLGALLAAGIVVRLAVAIRARRRRVGPAPTSAPAR